MRPISREKEQNIVALIEKGRSSRVIAKSVGLAQSTVNRVRKRLSTSVALPKGGRPKVLTEWEKRYASWLVTVGGLETATEASKVLRREMGVKMCENTLRNALREQGLSSFTKVKKPGLSRNNIKDIFRFAQMHKDWTTMPNEKVEEESKWWEQIQTHQKSAARLSKVEEARTLLAASSTATLSTISQKYDGFPLGSMVLHATDDTGRPILAISSLSPHTKDLETNPKCSLLVSRDASDISDTVVTIIGEAETVSDAEWEGVRAVYLKKYPDAFWVDFGDFRLVRITPKKIRFLAGSATAFVTFGELDGEEYLAAAVDPIAQFTAPIAGHMNRDHADQTKDIAENSLGVKIDYAKILQVDRLGFNIQTAHDGSPVKLRIPFPRPALDRKDVKNLIVEMLQGPAAATTT